MVNEVRAGISSLVDSLETCATPLMKKINGDFLERFERVRKAIKLPSIGNDGICYATQFSIGVDYWSPIHVDNDFFYTILSCLTPNEEDIGKILYYFCFPDYGIKIPMRSGDILVFNPLIKHSCSNPSLPGAYIFSAYVSDKTVKVHAKDYLNVK